MMTIGESSEYRNAAVKLRAVCAHAVERSLAIGGQALRHAGAAAVANDNVLQRIFRDLTVSAQHAMVADQAYEDWGKAQLQINHQKLHPKDPGKGSAS
jgi:alkylation response protein AidB-like acyl-CoA dehydrogenase